MKKNYVVRRMKKKQGVKAFTHICVSTIITFRVIKIYILCKSVYVFFSNILFFITNYLKFSNISEHQSNVQFYKVEIL